jgi:hypothetical protein
MSRFLRIIVGSSERTRAKRFRFAVLSLLLLGLSTAVCDAEPPVAIGQASTPGPGVSAFAASFTPFDGSATGSAGVGPVGSQNVAPPLAADPSLMFRESGAGICSPEIAPAAPQENRPVPIEASWTDGLHLESADKQFQFHFGGIVQVDSTWLIGPQSLYTAPGGAVSGVGNASATLLRRAILEADGSFYGQFDYFVAFDFSNASNDNSGLQPPSFGNLSSSPAPLNVWMQMRDVPILGNVRFGNQTKPIGMENNTSAAFLPFMERSDNNDAFYGPFDNGFALGLTAQP